MRKNYKTSFSLLFYGLVLHSHHTVFYDNSDKSKHTNIVKGTSSVGSVTPSKRKIFDIEGGEVKSLICIFESDITKPTWRDNSVSDSPAKRQRCVRQGPK